MSSQDLTKAITAGIKSNVDLIKNDIRDARYAREPMTFVIPFRKR